MAFQRRWPRRLWFGVIVLALLGTAAAIGYRAFQHVPAFYADAVRADAVRQPAPKSEDSGHALVRSMAALSSTTSRPGSWRATLNQQQINAYLATDLARLQPNLLPKNVTEPRIAVRPDGLYVGWRTTTRWSDAVYSICLVPYVTKPNQLAVRISRIRAGAIPVPLGEVLDKLSAAAAKSGVHLRWQQTDGDPVAVVDLPPLRETSAGVTLLDSVELRAGAIVLTGHTERVADREARAGAQPAENEYRQH